MSPILNPRFIEIEALFDIPRPDLGGPMQVTDRVRIAAELLAVQFHLKPEIFQYDEDKRIPVLTKAFTWADELIEYGNAHVERFQGKTLGQDARRS